MGQATPFDAAARGIAVEMRETVETPSPSTIAGYYAPGPLTYSHQKDAQGRHWVLISEAERDEVGWLVYRITRRALIPQPGDFVHARLQVLEHHGDSLLCQAEDKKGHATRRQIPIECVVFLEEAPSTSPTGAV